MRCSLQAGTAAGRARARRDQQGFSLLETMIALIVMGLTFGALLAGITTAITVTRDNKLRAQADEHGRTMAERLKSGENGRFGNFTYVPCATDYPAIPAVDADGWRYSLKIEYWKKPTSVNPAASDDYAGPGSGPTFCTTTAATTAVPFVTDSGAQRITLTVKPPKNTYRANYTTQSIVIIKRDTRLDCTKSTGNYTATTTTTPTGTVTSC